jgi:DNA polymerase III subunit alpha
MTDPRFVHLRLHSEYSIADGIVRLDDAVAAALRDLMPALALTDLSNLFGMVKFYKAARSAGIKPIIGCDVLAAGVEPGEPAHRVLLLCQSREGYLRLCDWLTRAYAHPPERGSVCLKTAWFHEGTGGLLALSGAPGGPHAGELGALLALEHDAAAAALARQWSQWFPGRYYIELQRAGWPDDQEANAAAIDLAARLGLPAVATHPVQFIRREDFTAHEARVCISEGAILADQRRQRRFTPEQYFKTQDEMASLFSDCPEALANAVEIAKRCNLTIELGTNYLPAFPTPPGVTLDQHLCDEAAAGLARRLLHRFPDPAERERRQPAYVERLEFELGIIIQMGFPGYFLIVADFINWARNHDVPVGPGRGSGASSLVAYSLGITDLDPLHYKLLFERFLNPERVSMPDFDIDFCQDGRDRVIDYVRQKYGAESVSQIATFGTMAAKAVVRDVGRVLDLGYTFCDGIAKLIPFQPGKLVTLRSAREMEPVLAERERDEEDVRELLALAESLEGLTRNVGMHAGGVLIAPGKLTDFCPLYVAENDGARISQFDKDDVEQIGLVKFDFLGLTTLTVLDWALRYIKRLDPGSTLDLEAIPVDDAPTFRLFQEGRTDAIFQFESRGMRDLLVQSKPTRLEDLIALNAMYRPGPMELIPTYIARKNGKERVEYLDSRLETILAETYGVMAYQEQVMQIAQVIAGYSLGAADLLRRAMGKKKPEEMALQRDIFVKGAVTRGMKETIATEVFDLMEKFAGYGFNKSHSAAYAWIAYQTAYLKVHYGSAFMAANLSATMDDSDKVRQFYEDALANGLTFLPPDVNASEYRFVPIDDKSIRYGLGAIKGTGRAAVDAIIAARTERSFGGFVDFCRRIDKRAVNRRAIEALIKGGAFDALEPNRAMLIASVGPVLELAEQETRAAQQVNLFGEGTGSGDVQLIAAKPWNDLERLRQEKTALGFYFSGHPYASYRQELAGLIKQPLGKLAARRESVLLAGLVTQLRTQATRRGKMGFVTLDDGTAQIEVSVFNELFEAHRLKLKEDEVLIVEGKVSEDGYTGGLRVVADQLLDLDTVRSRFAKELRLSCNGGSNGSDGQRLLALLKPYVNGNTAVTVDYQNECARGELELGLAWKVTLGEHLLTALRDWLAPENVDIVWDPPPPAAPVYRANQSAEN